MAHLTSNHHPAGFEARFSYSLGDSSLGVVLVAASVQGVAAVLLGEQPHALVQSAQQRLGAVALRPGGEAHRSLLAAVLRVLEAPAEPFARPLDLRGTAFQQAVWRALRTIAPGTTASYKQVAQRIGRPGGARAVGAACAANPLAVLVPCHRVVNSNGSLSSYAWGIERKRMLLARECTRN